MAKLTDKQIKSKCAIAYPKRSFKPTVTFKTFLNNFTQAGYWQENTNIPWKTYYDLAKCPYNYPVVMTSNQAAEKTNGMTSYNILLRDKLAEDGLYIGRVGFNVRVFKYSENMDAAVKPRNRKSKRSCERNDVLMSNTPTGSCPGQSKFIADNQTLITDLSKWC